MRADGWSVGEMSLIDRLDGYRRVLSGRDRRSLFQCHIVFSQSYLMFLYKWIQPIARRLPASWNSYGLMCSGRFRRLVAGYIAVRWAATSFMGAEKRHRKVMGYRDPWRVEAHVDEVGAP